MKIGILTFHSQLNYGGVLQSWALQTALQNLGHDVVVIDRWMSKGNENLEGNHSKVNIAGSIKFIIRSMLGLGDWGARSRRKRTKAFIGQNLNLTPYHFVKWDEAPADLGLDMIVVGSDQVWHCGDWGDPSVYLLEGSERCNIPTAISYAASFGLKELPVDFIPLYKRGLARFKAISCREREGEEICKSLSFAATHVVDPTLLIEPQTWRKIIDASERTGKNKPRLVCYFMSVDVKTVLPYLSEFAKRMKCKVDVLANNGVLQPIPRSIGEVVGNNRFKSVNILRSADPIEFVKEFSRATWVLTDSFHAVMFASIFGCNARFIRPSNAMRAVMFARIQEFAIECVKGNLFVDDVKAALDSFERGETVSFDQQKIASLRDASLAWLKSSLTTNQ